MFERILVPLDGSARAERALSVAARIAHASDGGILLLRVVSAPVDYGGGPTTVPLFKAQMIESGLEASSYLKTTAQAAVLVGIATASEVMFGSADQQILTAAGGWAADLIIIFTFIQYR